MATIRYWAAARAAAGVDAEDYDVTTLADLVAAARAAHARDERGDRFSRVLGACSWVVDETPVGTRDHAAVVLSADSVAEALPPFAGGSDRVPLGVHCMALGGWSARIGRW